MTPEQIQRLRELEAKVGAPGSACRNSAIWHWESALVGAGPELLDDWERMRRALEQIWNYSKETSERHFDHVGLSEDVVNEGLCILCLIESVAKEALSRD